MNCPVGADDKKPCTGQIKETGRGFVCDRDPAHAWLPDGKPRYQIVSVGEVRGSNE